jgi:hypothetical protein
MKTWLLQAAINIPGLPQVKFDDQAIANAASAAFVVAGAMTVLFIVIGAIRYATSAGDQAQINQAKNTILYAVIGLVISLSSFVIVQFVLGRITR